MRAVAGSPEDNSFVHLARKKADAFDAMISRVRKLL
jgi:hypothetical protein